VLAFESATGRRRRTPRTSITVLLALTGLTLLLGVPEGQRDLPTLLAGAGFALLAAAGFATLTVVGSRPVGDLDVRAVLDVWEHQRRLGPGPGLAPAYLVDCPPVRHHREVATQRAHGSMPQAAVDPVVLASSIVVRLQTIVAREISPTDTAVLTVGSIQAGTKSNVIPDSATILLNVRSYSEQTRTAILDAIERIVNAECAASGSPAPPEFELFDRFPVTDNDPHVTERVAAAFADHFGDRAGELPLQTASEDFSDLPSAFGVPYTYWGIGGIDPDLYAKAEAAGRIAQDVPVNHSAQFGPVLEPTLDTGTSALVVAALAWLAPSGSADETGATA
jgi:hypothetical protein